MSGTKRKHAESSESSVAYAASEDDNDEREDEAGLGSPLRDRLLGIVAAHTCSITHELIIDPVLGEDGHLYESSAIVRWLASRPTSPRTNEPMGPRLLDSIAARQTIRELIDSRVVSRDAAASWHLGTGIATAVRAASAAPGGATAESALDQLRRAIALGAGDEARLHSEGVELMMRLTDFQRRAATAGLDVSYLPLPPGTGHGSHGNGSARDAAGHHAVTGRAMTAWRHLEAGARVRIIDDVAEAERLCNVAAPGAVELTPVGWGEQLEAMCGNEYVVMTSDAADRSYALRSADGTGDVLASFPFTACVLLQTTGASSPHPLQRTSAMHLATQSRGAAAHSAWAATQLAHSVSSNAHVW